MPSPARPPPFPFPIPAPQALRYSGLSHLRDLCAVLLRRTLLLDEVSVWEKMSPSSHTLLKSVLLEVIETDTVRSIRRNVADTVSDLAIGTLMEDQPWPELFAKMDAWARGTNYDLREYSLYIFEMMSHYFVIVSRALVHVVCGICMSLCASVRVCGCVCVACTARS